MRSFIYSLVLLATTLPVLVYGQGKVYSPLVNIPGNEAGGFEQYISFLYGASISVAALLAVVKIIIAGAKYMLSDVITNKGEAIKDIQGAILGLLLILGAVIILEFINPQLIKGNIQFQTIPERPDIAIAGTNAAIAAKQNSELTEGLSNCVSSSTGIGTSGNKNVTTIDVNKCPGADLQRSNYTIFKNNCEEANPPGQIARTGEEGSGQYRCAVTIRGKTFSIDGYSADVCGTILCDKIELIDNDTYVKKDGRIVTYDAARFCQEKYPKLDLDDCKDAVGDAFTSSESIQNSPYNAYCENNGGKILGRFSCQLPANTVDIFGARQKSDTSINNQEQFETFCKTQFDGTGIFVDTKRSDAFSLADALCVKY